jgi:hypothetical protein
LALLRRGWRHRRAWWRAWHGYGGCLSGLALQHLSDLALVNGMSLEPLIPTGVLAVRQNASHQMLVQDCDGGCVALATGSGLLWATTWYILCCVKPFWALSGCVWPVGWQWLTGGNWHGNG